MKNDYFLLTYPKHLYTSEYHRRGNAKLKIHLSNFIYEVKIKTYLKMTTYEMHV